MKQLIKQVDEILFNHWDPIGVNWAAPRDEYSGYAPAVAMLIVNGAATEAIATHLDRIAVERMGLKPKPEKARRAASLLLALRKPETE